ncbi:hypothetical protein ACS0PU_004804 [Formica fusca]
MEESEKGEKEVGKSYWGWWDKECIEKKKEVRRELREWRKGKKIGEGFRKTKREYKELCEKKKEEEREKLIREAAEAKTESKVWEIVNRERRKRKGIEEGIQMGK